MSDEFLMPDHGSNFRQVFDRVAWAAMTVICFYAASQIREMTASVSDLNKNFAVMVERVSNQQGQLNGISEHLNAVDRRITALELSGAQALRRRAQ